MLSKLLVLPPLSSPLWHKFILTKCMNMQRLLGIHAWKMGFLNPTHYSYFRLNIVVEKTVRCLTTHCGSLCGPEIQKQTRISKLVVK